MGMYYKQAYMYMIKFVESCDISLMKPLPSIAHYEELNFSETLSCHSLVVHYSKHVSLSIPH